LCKLYALICTLLMQKLMNSSRDAKELGVRREKKNAHARPLVVGLGHTRRPKPGAIAGQPS